MQSQTIAYFDALIANFDPENSNRHVHLGYWSVDDILPDQLSYEDFIQAQIRLNEEIIRLSDLNHYTTLLDVGCGLGGNIELINNTIDHSLLVGVNIDSRQLDACHSITPQNHNQITWLHADACDLPFDNHSFSRITSIEAMFHFSSRHQFFSEIARILEPGGIFCGTDMLVTPDAPIEYKAALQSGYAPWPEIHTVNKDYQSMATAHGLEILQLRDISKNTGPGYEFTATPVDFYAIPEHHHMARAGAALKALNNTSMLQYQLIKMRKTE